MAVLPENWQVGGFGLYLHWPFCAAKCPYCDFNSHVSNAIDHDAWLNAYIEEIEKAAELTNGRVLSTVFFGGGTPSLMKPKVVHDILDKISASWPIANDLEITLEANPTSVDATKFADLSKAGVNRVSLGVQALSDEDLQRLGRLHSVADARGAIDTALTHFNRVSFDLIYARQHQTLSDWEQELKKALTLGVSHLSLYQLTIEDGTAFGDRFKKGTLRGLPTEDTGAEMYELTQDICEDAGLPAYEVSNHATRGEQARHNLIYWNSGDYVGVGPGAHGRLFVDGHRVATEQEAIPAKWLSGRRDLPQKRLSAADFADEMVMMGLRLIEGFDSDRLRAQTGIALQNIEDLRSEGWLDQDNGHLRATRAGRLLLNSVIERLLDCRSGVRS